MNETSKQEEIIGQLVKLLQERGKEGLELARKTALEEKIDSKEAREALEYFMNECWKDYTSSAVKGGDKQEVVKDLSQVLQAAKPEIVYTHNLADKHDTHVAVTLRVIEAIRNIGIDQRPGKVYGCEVWRDLDWIADKDKVTFDVSAHENLQAALLGVFDSQISGGKRYDLATMGRRRANATYFESHGTDVVTAMIYAMDLTPLIDDPHLGYLEFLEGFVERLSMDMQERLIRASDYPA